MRETDGFACSTPEASFRDLPMSHFVKHAPRTVYLYMVRAAFVSVGSLTRPGIWQ